MVSTTWPQEEALHLAPAKTVALLRLDTYSGEPVITTEVSGGPLFWSRTPGHDGLGKDDDVHYCS
jgi:hypothetical protein